MASSSSSQVHPEKNDVFINFRGADVRPGFLSHLTKELRRMGVHVYVDERLERGQEIESALLTAIEESLISLVIFSKDYASSTWCLDELVRIMECRKDNDQIVIPVFYNVDPRDVRWLEEGNCKAAFAKLKNELKDDTDKLEVFKSTLKNAANISGYHLASTFPNEAILVEEIVKDVLKKLDFIFSSSESAGLVGIDQPIADILWFLEKKASAVQIIGIWGMGGIGKTTIAQAVYKKFFLKYDRCCFLENVRDVGEGSLQMLGLRSLRNQLFSELLVEKFSFLKERLRHQRVLIVLDDVSTPEQLKYLVKEQISLGPDSRVIVTSRDRQVLNIGRARPEIHEVKGLNFEDSLELFCLNAFGENHPEMGYEELSRKIVDYADGLPKALKVLGSLLLPSRDIETWENELRELKRRPNEEIQNVLKLSYDGLLDNNKKNIFLDIAFFYKGQCKDDVINLLNNKKLNASLEIDCLLDRALVTISDNRIEMHSLIQEMGWEIVRQDSRRDPRRCTQSEVDKEVDEVLHIGDMHLSRDNFHEMTNLRFSKLQYLEATSLNRRTDSMSFSNKPRRLHWDEYPLESLPSNLFLENLVELQARCSLIENLWDGMQNLENLKELDLWGSKQLKELPDFSKAPNLERLELLDCKSLCHVHPSVLSLPSIVYLGLWGCKSLKSLQSEALLKSLQQLDIGGCSSSCELSLSIRGITDIMFSLFSIKIVHSSDGHFRPALLDFNGSTLKIRQTDELSRLKSLEDPSLSDCSQVNVKTMLNIEVGNLCSLRELYLDGCSNFLKLSESINCLSSLQVLRIKGCGIENLPPCIKFLEMLEILDLSDCKRLGSLPELPKSITHLNVNNCSSLKSVSTVTLLLQNYSIKFLSLMNCVDLCQYSVMEDAHLLLQRLSLGIASASICYPGNKVPQWFKNNWTANASVNLELSPTRRDLEGLVFAFVLCRFNSKQKYRIHLSYQFEDGEKVQGTSYGYMTADFSSDHVFLLYDGFCSDQILRGLLDRRRRRDDQSTIHSQKLSVEFTVVVNDETTQHDDLIKECGVCPMYLSEYPVFSNNAN